MTTLTALADRIQATLGDDGTVFTQTNVEAWVNEAIRDYSQHFPREITASIDCSDDDRDYDLPAGFQSVISVEYPAGEDTPKYLKRLTYHHPDFWNVSGYYDVIAHRDVDDVDELLISEEPDDEETITLIYLGDHDFSLGSSDTITVPGRHEPLLIQFVTWKAYIERATSWSKLTGDANAAQAAMYQKLAVAAEKSYKDMVEKALIEGSETGPILRWRMPDGDRIY